MKMQNGIMIIFILNETPADITERLEQVNPGPATREKYLHHL